MDVVELVGRLLFAATFLITPSGVIAMAPRVAGAPPLKPFPAPLRVPMIRATCICSMLGSVLVGVGLWPDVGALLILAFLVPVTLTMHRFWELEPGLPRKQKRDAFLSNTSMAGAALFIFAVVNQAQDVPLALVAEPLFGRL